MNRQQFVNICASLPLEAVIRGMEQFGVSLAELENVLSTDKYEALAASLCQAEDEAWDAIAANSTNEGDELVSLLQHYISTYPRGKHADDANNRLVELEQAAWNKAMMENTALAFDAFIADFPDSQHREEALNRKDDAEWQRLSAEDRYDDYLTAFPNGRHNDDALQGKKDPEWFKVQRISEDNRLPALRAYQEKFPDRHCHEIAQMIEKLTDESDWARAKQAGTPNAYQSYLVKHPNGGHASEASGRIEEWAGVIDYLNDLKINPNSDTADSIKRKLLNGEFNFEMLAEAVGRSEAEAIHQFRMMSDPSPENKTNPSDKLQEHTTEVYFWGTKGSGKTCAMGALLSGAYSLEPFLMQQQRCRSGYYMTKLKQIFSPDRYTPLPLATNAGAIEEMVMILNDQKGRKHRVTFIDIAGELVQSFFDESAGIVVIPELKQAQEKLKSYLNSTANRKIHFFVVEYNSHRNPISGVQIATYLEAMSQFLNENIKYRTNGVYLLVTKSDLMQGFHTLDTTARATAAEEYVKTYFNNFYTNMRRLCHKTGVKNFRTVYFTIGKVIGQQLCKFDPSETRKILNEILLKSSVVPTTRWEKFLAWLNDD